MQAAYMAPGAVCLGDVRFGPHCSIWVNAVVRGDSAPIVVAEGTNIQDCCVLHVDAGFPLHIGRGVTVGHGAILHGCTIGDNCLVGMGSIILNGAQIGADSLVAAGALVPQGRSYPPGVLLVGAPARVIRPLSQEEIADNRRNAQQYWLEAQAALHAVAQTSTPPRP